MRWKRGPGETLTSRSFYTFSTCSPQFWAVAVWSVLWREAESRDELFVSTRWTMVLKAGDSAATSVQALSALSELCQIYWRNPFFMPRARVEFRESPRWRACFSFARARKVIRKAPSGLTGVLPW